MSDQQLRRIQEIVKQLPYRARRKIKEAFKVSDHHGIYTLAEVLTNREIKAQAH